MGNEANATISRRLRIEPLDTGNWDQFVELFGRNGACGNCWCVFQAWQPGPQDRQEEGRYYVK